MSGGRGGEFGKREEELWVVWVFPDVDCFCSADDIMAIVKERYPATGWESLVRAF